MKITGRNYNLKPGTILEDVRGIIAIDSEYDTNHKRYEYHDMDCNDEGELVDLPTGGYVTPLDLIGYEIVCEPKPIIKSFEYKEVSEADVQALESADIEFDCVVNDSENSDFIIRYEKAISQQVQKIISNSLNSSLKR